MFPVLNYKDHDKLQCIFRRDILPSLHTTYSVFAKTSNRHLSHMSNIETRLELKKREQPTPEKEELCVAFLVGTEESELHHEKKESTKAYASNDKKYTAYTEINRSGLEVVKQGCCFPAAPTILKPVFKKTFRMKWVPTFKGCGSKSINIM